MQSISIYEGDGVYDYLSKHGLLKQYRKTKRMLMTGNNTGAKFHKKQPKHLDVYYFRINKKYRAIGKFDNDGDFRVGEIDDHQ